MSTQPPPTLPQRTPAPVLPMGQWHRRDAGGPLEFEPLQTEDAHPDLYAETVAKFDGFDPHYRAFVKAGA